MNDLTIMSACACRPSEDPLSVVNKCIESLEKLVNLKTSADRALYVASIERLQHAVCSEGEIICLWYISVFLNYIVRRAISVLLFINMNVINI